jgi:hypothetical protein
LVFYFCFIFFLFPETKRLSAEDASRAFDYDRNGFPLDKMEDAEEGVVSPDQEKPGSGSAIEKD